jgi:hypothetical protein
LPIVPDHGTFDYSLLMTLDAQELAAALPPLLPRH